jgi:hypothetical protein
MLQPQAQDLLLMEVQEIQPQIQHLGQVIKYTKLLLVLALLHGKQ